MTANRLWEIGKTKRRFTGVRSVATYEWVSGMQFRRLPKVQKTATAITDHDRGHMNAFPVEQRVRIIRKIMTNPPVTEWNLDGNESYVNAMLRLRARGMELIDLQPQEHAFTAIWYRRERSLWGRPKAEVAAMVVWEADENSGGTTTVRVWHL